MVRYSALWLSVVFLLLLQPPAIGAYEVTDNCRQAWMLAMDLKIDEARAKLKQELIANPDNYYALYLEQTCDVFRLMINSSDQEYSAFLKSYEEKRAIMDGKDEQSPYYLACAAEMDIQVTVFQVMHGAQLSALRKGYSAYRKVYKNLEKFPDFPQNKKLDGFFNVAIANMPPFVKWAISFFGVTVDMDYGFRTIQSYYEEQKNSKGLNAEAALYMILAAKINKTPERVYEFTRTLGPDVARTFIHTYFRANIAYRTGRNEEALATLQMDKPSDEELSGIIYDYLMGKILLRKLDPHAGHHFKRYLSHLEKQEYRKEMHYNLALVHLIQGDREGYRKQCGIVKSEGMDLNERDREALYDASLDYAPDVNLIKARLSLEGGYRETFLRYMLAFDANPSQGLPYRLEYAFLKARDDASQKNNPAAIRGFTQVIEQGEDADYFFACESALRLGWIYQLTGRKDLAIESFRKSIDLYRNEYYEYIEDKARKGLASLEKK